jgi:hypothetical protein
MRDCLFTTFAATLHVWRPSPPSTTWRRTIPWCEENYTFIASVDFISFTVSVEQFAITWWPRIGCSINHTTARFEVFVAVKFQVEFFWLVTQCSDITLVIVCQVQMHRNYSNAISKPTRFVNALYFPYPAVSQREVFCSIRFAFLIFGFVWCCVTPHNLSKGGICQMEASTENSFHCSLPHVVVHWNALPFDHWVLIVSYQLQIFCTFEDMSRVLYD